MKYKAPNLTISPKRKVYSKVGGGGHSTMKPSTHTLSHSPPLPPPLSLFLSFPPPTPIHTNIYHSVRKRRLLGREKMCL